MTMGGGPLKATRRSLVPSGSGMFSSIKVFLTCGSGEGYYPTEQGRRHKEPRGSPSRERALVSVPRMALVPMESGGTNSWVDRVALVCHRCDVTWRGVPLEPCWLCGSLGLQRSGTTLVRD